MPYLSCKKIENDVYNFPTWQYCKYKDIFDSRIIINSTAKFYISISYQKDLLSIDTRIFTPSKNHRFNSQKPPRDFSYLLAASLHYIIKLLYNTHAFIDPVLNHRSTYFKIVGYFFSFHSIRSHGQSSFFCLWHHDFIKIESQIADIFQLDDDNTPV